MLLFFFWDSELKDYDLRIWEIFRNFVIFDNSFKPLINWIMATKDGFKTANRKCRFNICTVDN